MRFLEGKAADRVFKKKKLEKRKDECLRRRS